MSEQAEALRRIKEIGHGARLRAPMPLQDWKNTVVRMEREAEEALFVPKPTGEGEATGTQTVPDRMSVAYWHRLQADELKQRAGENDTAWIMRLRQHFASSKSSGEEA